MFGKFRQLRELHAAEREGRKKKRVLSPDEIFQLQLQMHAQTRRVTEDEWKRHFSMADLHGREALTGDEFRNACRRANIRPDIISDRDIANIVKVVDEDGSGFIELGEFLTFLRPAYVPDVGCKASSWRGNKEGIASDDSHRSPKFAVNNVGMAMTADGMMVHTGEIDWHAWSTDVGVRGEEVWIEFEFPQVYFITHIVLWNLMSWLATKESDNMSALSSFDLSYSLNGKVWILLGRVKDLPRIPSTGIDKYYGECIQNRSLGGKTGMPRNHQKASLVEVDEFFRLPAKFMKFHNLENFGVASCGNMYGINSVHFYGNEAVGDCNKSCCQLQQVTSEVFHTHQFVVKLDLSHNNLSELPQQLSLMVLLQELDISYNYMTEFPSVLFSPEFISSIRLLDISFNMLKRLPPDVGSYSALEVLRVAGMYFDKHGLPDELGKLKTLKVLDISGLPFVADWLWDEQARQRQGLCPADMSDRTRITEDEFVAYVREHPLLLYTLGVPGARAMFHRYDSNKSISLNKEYTPSLDLQEAQELDNMLMQIFQKPFCGIPDSVWLLDSLTQLPMQRSGIENFRYPSSTPKLPVTGMTKVMKEGQKLGIFTLLEEQARSFERVLQLQVTDVIGAVENERTERVLEEIGFPVPNKVRGSETVSEEEIVVALRRERREKETLEEAKKTKDVDQLFEFQGRKIALGRSVAARTHPCFDFRG
eukprot:748419-Hanusia_phi.AAC.1